MCQAIFKCGLCGKQIVIGVNKSAEEKVDLTISCECKEEIYKNEDFMDLWQPWLHNCQDGSLGFAVFQGFKKIGE